MNARTQHGFSLIELAIVLVIIGLLVGGGIAALSATTEQTNRAAERQQLRYVREALYGFAMSTGRLPCADSDSPPDGKENYDSGTNACESGANRGALPWVTLGLARRDAWGNPLRYRVDASYADAPAAGTSSSFALDADAALEVYDAAGGSLVADDVPAVVVSYGPQGGQVWTSTGFTCPGSGAGFSADEQENCDDDGNFVATGYRGTATANGRFDDMLTWTSGPVLKARMVDAGRLP